MKNFLATNMQKSFFACLFVVAFFVAQSPAQALSEILNRIENQRKILQTLQASIEMGKLNPQTGDWEYNKGKVILVAKSKQIKDGLFRIDWTDPKPETLSIFNGKYYAYDPGIKTVYTGAATQKKAADKGGSIFSLVSMSKAQMNAAYSAKLAGLETLNGGTSAFHITLTPKMASDNKSIDIWADKDGVIHQAKTTAKNGDENSIKLTGQVRNKTLDISLFKVKLPAGTQEIKQ